MKQFLSRLSFLMILCLIVIIYIFSKANGYTDAYYLRFTTPKQNSLILGTSRAAQAIQPSVLDSILGNRIYNFAFTNRQSPYGSVYYESIKKKINKESKNGIFIVAISPWSISSITEDPNNYKNFREVDLCLDNTSIVNMNPNIQYLLNNYSEPYYKLLFEKNKSNVFLHNDGWLEVSVEMDSVSVHKRLETKINTYNNLTNYEFSTYRLGYLENIVNYLQQYGKVYLVRLPVHEKILEIENKIMPDFEDKISAAINHSSGYYNFTTTGHLYSYTDGNHLYKTSGYDISVLIAELIKNGNKKYNTELSIH